MQTSMRTIECGEITKDQLGKELTLTGWVDTRRDHGGLIFIDLRDRSGIMQLVFNPELAKDIHEQAHSLRSEYVIKVVGDVVKRTPETISKDLPTVEVELHMKNL